MPTFDCRREPAFGSGRFPCPVRIEDARTGERVPEVFFADTVTGRIGRRVKGPDGKLLLHPSGQFFLEHWDHLPWRAVSLADGRVVAQAEGANEPAT